MARTNGLSAATDSVKEALHDFGVKVVDVKDSVVDGGKTGAMKLGALIKAHPFAAVGIALGIGYLAMRLMRR